MLGHHAARPTRRVDRAWGDGGFTRVGARIIRPLHRVGTVGCGGGLLHHQVPMRRREGRQEPRRQGKAGHQTFDGSRRFGHPFGHHHRPGQPPRFAAVGHHPPTRWRIGRRTTRGNERAPGSRLRFGSHPRTSRGTWTARRDLSKGATGPTSGNEALGGREDEFLAQRPQEAGVVHGEERKGDRLLGGLLRGGHHRA